MSIQYLKPFYRLFVYHVSIGNVKRSAGMGVPTVYKPNYLHSPAISQKASIFQDSVFYCQLKGRKVQYPLFTENNLNNMNAACPDLQGSRSDVGLIWHNGTSSTAAVGESVFCAHTLLNTLNETPVKSVAKVWWLHSSEQRQKERG